MSKIFEDEKIDIEISKFFQNMNVNGYFSISIDPVEFMTMSITKNKWSSCYNIQNGCFSNCPLGLILDECSMVCYRHNGNKFIYEFENIGSNVTFEHNSKQIRNVISVNPDSKFVVVYRPCVCVDTSYYKMLESTFFEFTKEKGFVKNFISDSYSNCIRIRQKGVTHIKDDFKYCFSCNSELTDKDFVILSSKSVKNPINGKEVSKNSEM